MTSLPNLVKAGDGAGIEKALRTRSKDVDERDGEGQTALHVAAYECNLDLVKQFVWLGADVNATDKRQWTPLHSASSRCCDEECANKALGIITFLLNTGADPNAVTLDGTTPLHMLSRMPFSPNAKNVFRSFFTRGADVNVPNAHQQTPLHQASIRGSPETVEFLLSCGAAIDAADRLEETALHVAARAGRVDTVRLLLQYSASITLRGPQGTARQVAELTNNQAVIDALAEREAKMKEPAEVTRLNLDVVPDEPKLCAPRLGCSGGAASWISMPAIPVKETTVEDEPGRSARRHRRTVQPEQIVEAHDDFNLDLGNYAMTTFAHEFEMEYSGEHDVCDYTTMFLVDCEGYFKGDGSPLPLAAFHPHMHMIGVEGKDDVICSVLTEGRWSHEGRCEGYRCIIRSCTGIKSFLLPPPLIKKPRAKNFVDAIQFCVPSIHNLCPVEDVELSNNLLTLDQVMRVSKHKFGVVYCTSDTTEDTIWDVNMEDTSEEFRNFVRFLGDEVDLKGYSGYAGDLDKKNDMTGKTAIVNKFGHLSLVFQVAPSIQPATDRRQPIIGNTIVTIVFQDGGSFDPEIILSQVLHVYVVVQPVTTEDGTIYKVAVASRKGVPRFRPNIPLPSFFRLDDQFRKFLFYKLVNAERSAYHCATTLRRQKRALVEIVQMTRAGHIRHYIEKVPDKRKKVKHLKAERRSSSGLLSRVFS